MRSLVLFSNDLRLNDNDAINNAVVNHQELSFLFIFDKYLYQNTHGSANMWWLKESLKELKSRLKEKDIELQVVEGDYTKKIIQLVVKHKFDAVFLNQNKHPEFIKKEEELSKALIKINVSFYSYNKTNLHDPKKILNKSSEPYKVYSPFYKHCKSIYHQKDVLMFPRKKINTYNIKEKNFEIDNIFYEKDNKWVKKFNKYWKPGEVSAHKKLKIFYEKSLSNYKEIRDFPDTDGTSKMSPHLRFGEITTNQIISNFNFHENHNLNKHEEHYIKELYWREFAYYILNHFPYVVNKPFNKKYEKFQWEKNYSDNLEKWRNGQTGIRIVDAAMKELWETGWMHNRTRMITASFLTKNLLIPWQEGEQWFRDTLLDADIANNVMGWQWVSGCGTDAAPYFRIFNPLLQEKKFDPDNRYTKKWLKDFEMYEDEENQDLFCNPGKIKPIVDLGISRNEALERFSKIK